VIRLGVRPQISRGGYSCSTVLYKYCTSRPLQINTSHHHQSLTSNQTFTGYRAPLALLPNILALPSRLRAGFFIILFFIVTSAILASTRFGSRLASLFRQIRPAAAFPAFTRPVTTSTMAPKVYQKPPQAPPSFIATTTSLVEDAKAICGMFTGRRPF
jgi:hypothetical protein